MQNCRFDHQPSIIKKRPKTLTKIKQKVLNQKKNEQIPHSFKTVSKNIIFLIFLTKNLAYMC